MARKRNDHGFFDQIDKRDRIDVCLEKDLYFFAECARLAYKDRKVGKEAFNSIGFSSHSFISIDSAQVHCAANKQRVVIAFRGTQPIEFNDVVADINFFPTKQSQGEGTVHQGFKAEVDKLEDSIMKFIDKNSDKAIYVCGHSLGGAMATIFSARNEDLVEKLFTYGSPRAGNGQFIKLMTTPHHRCVNNNDIVAHVPPSIYFRHHGEIHYLNFWGKNRNLHGWQKTKDAWRGILAAAKRGQFFDFLTDHNMQKYSDYLKRNWLDVDLDGELL